MEQKNGFLKVGATLLLVVTIILGIVAFVTPILSILGGLLGDWFYILVESGLFGLTKVGAFTFQIFENFDWSPVIAITIVTFSIAILTLFVVGIAFVNNIVVLALSFKGAKGTNSKGLLIANIVFLVFVLFGMFPATYFCLITTRIIGFIVFFLYFPGFVLCFIGSIVGLMRAKQMKIVEVTIGK